MITTLIALSFLSLIAITYGFIAARPLFSHSKIHALSLISLTTLASLSLYALVGSPSLALQPPVTIPTSTALLNQALASPKKQHAISLSSTALLHTPSLSDKILATRIIRNHNPNHPLIFPILSDILSHNPQHLEATWFSALHLSSQKQYKKALPLLLQAKSLIQNTHTPQNKKLINTLNTLIANAQQQLNLASHETTPHLTPQKISP